MNKIKICSFNMENFVNINMMITDKFNFNKYDIICIQELYDYKLKSEKSKNLKYLNELINNMKYEILSTNSTNCIIYNKEKFELFRKLKNIKNISFKKSNICCILNYKLSNKKICIINVHLPAPKLQSSRLIKYKNNMELINTLYNINTYVKQSDYQILCGDFNINYPEKMAFNIQLKKTSILNEYFKDTTYLKHNIGKKEWYNVLEKIYNDISNNKRDYKLSCKRKPNQQSNGNGNSNLCNVHTQKISKFHENKTQHKILRNICKRKLLSNKKCNNVFDRIIFGGKDIKNIKFNDYKIHNNTFRYSDHAMISVNLLL